MKRFNATKIQQLTKRGERRQNFINKIVNKITIHKIKKAIRQAASLGRSSIIIEPSENIQSLIPSEDIPIKENHIKWLEQRGFKVKREIDIIDMPHGYKISWEKENV